jgi:hypothetical protein
MLARVVVDQKAAKLHGKEAGIAGMFVIRQPNIKAVKGCASRRVIAIKQW